MEKLNRFHVCFMREAPRIGSGWRVVSAHIGRKWVHVTAAGGHAKLSLEQWAELARHGKPLIAGKRRRRTTPSD